jgi:hypothetical protein
MARGLKPRLEPAIEKALQAQSNLSDLDLTLICHCDRRSAARILADLRRYGLVHISGHVRIHANGQYRPLWSWGEGVDAQPPAAVPPAQRSAKHRANQSQQDKDFNLAKRRHHRKVIKIDPLTAAFFGR